MRETPRLGVRVVGVLFLGVGGVEGDVCVESCLDAKAHRLGRLRPQAQPSKGCRRQVVLLSFTSVLLIDAA